MPEYTTNFNLPKPLPNENVSREAHNSIVDAIDSQIGEKLASHKADNDKHVTSAERTAWNAKVDQSALASHLADYATHVGTDATTSVKGHVELATTAETTTGTDTVRAVTPAGVKAVGDTKAPLRYGSSTKTANYTLVLGDANSRIFVNSSSARTITVPPNSSAAFSVGDEIEVIRLGTGTVTFVAGSGVMINSKESKLAIDGQYAGAILLKTATDAWLLIGSLA